MCIRDRGTGAGAGATGGGGGATATGGATTGRFGICMLLKSILVRSGVVPGITKDGATGAGAGTLIACGAGFVATSGSSPRLPLRAI